MAKKRKKREPQQVDFDLTPMIDVTFQLLIFFIVAMKFKQPERRQGANLSLESGQSTAPDVKTPLITIRLDWEPNAGTMSYQVCRNDDKTSAYGPIEGGSLKNLLEDRFNNGYPHYSTVYNSLMDHINRVHNLEPEATKMEIALTNETQKSASLQVSQLPPWGFVTLALDACTGHNKRIKENPIPGMLEKQLNDGLEIVTKNSSPFEAADRSNE